MLVGELLRCSIRLIGAIAYIGAGQWTIPLKKRPALFQQLFGIFCLENSMLLVSARLLVRLVLLVLSIGLLGSPGWSFCPMAHCEVFRFLLTALYATVSHAIY